MLRVDGGGLQPNRLRIDDLDTIKERSIVKTPEKTRSGTTIDLRSRGGDLHADQLIVGAKVSASGYRVAGGGRSTSVGKPNEQCHL